MATLEIETFKKVVDEIISETRDGKITWNRLNPSTYSFSRTSGRVTLQEASKNVRALIGPGRVGTREIKTHLFQVTDTAGAPQLVVNSAETSEAKEILEKLFEAVASGVTKKGVDFLKSIIEEK